jgi:hypothetical protein
MSGPLGASSAGPGNAGVGNAGLGNAGLGNAGLGNAGLGNAGLALMSGQWRLGQVRARHDGGNLEAARSALRISMHEPNRLTASTFKISAAKARQGARRRLPLARQ